MFSIRSASIIVIDGQSRTSGRTMLLFVIRDHIGVTPLANLAQTLKADLSKIWDSLSKPAEVQNCKLEDYFDLSFTALPHKVRVPPREPYCHA
jgi:protein SEY1